MDPVRDPVTGAPIIYYPAGADLVTGGLLQDITQRDNGAFLGYLGDPPTAAAIGASFMYDVDNATWDRFLTETPEGEQPALRKIMESWSLYRRELITDILLHGQDVRRAYRPDPVEQGAWERIAASEQYELQLQQA